MSELHKVRRFPAEEKRVESGPIMFGDDWPGLFLRGDDCLRFLVSLREVLYEDAKMGTITRHVLMGLADALDSSNAKNNDAFPAWHEENP